MMRLYPTTVLITLLFTLLCTSVRAQTTLAEQSFEGAGTWAFTPNPAVYNASNDVWDAVNSLGGISPSDGASFWGMRDLNNGNGGGNFDHVLAFGAFTVLGETAMQLSFEWNVQSLNTGGDAISYEYFLDGVGQGVVVLAVGEPDVTNTGWTTETVVIPDGTDNVSLNLIGNFDGGSDIAGYDNVLLTADNPADPCGITSFGPENVVCVTESPSGSTDLFRIEIPYSGLDADAILLVEAGATTPVNDVTATTTNVGDDFTVTSNGTIILENSAGEFEEGDEVRVTLTDAGGDCSFVLNISTTDNQCSNPCDPNINPSNIVFTCAANTAGDDMGTAIIPFTNGPEAGATVSVSPAVTISGDDIATEEDGDIILTGITEGTTYTLTVSGGGCTGTEELVVMVPFSSGLCQPSDLVINEVNYDPFISGGSTDLTRDPNQDGVSNGTTDEFIEFFNTAEVDLDISGYTVEDNVGVFITFPLGTTITAGTGFVVFAQPPTVSIGCPTFGSDRVVGSAMIPAIGLNNTGDLINVRDGIGGIVASFSYDASAPNDQSLARSPDLTGPFVGHLGIAANPVPHSACIFNDQPGVALPVELLGLEAIKNGKQVLINWSTAREENNDYFVVDRSASGVEWTEIGMVNAGSAAANAYEFVDADPLAGANYYRLRQLDIDGASTIFGPVAVVFEEAGFSIYPNPASDEIIFTTRPDAANELSLLSADGRLLRRLRAGADRVEIGDLTPGLYLLRVESESKVETLRFVKQ